MNMKRRFFAPRASAPHTVGEGYLERYAWGDYLKSFSGSYRGSIADFKPHGFGCFTGIKSGMGGPDAKAVYNGEWVDGKMEGQGTLTLEVGTARSIYEGEFKGGDLEGRGKRTGNVDGIHYTEEGAWKQDRLAQGSLRLGDGRWFDGEWVRDYYPAKGVLGEADGTRWAVDYEGKTFLSPLSWRVPPTRTRL